MSNNIYSRPARQYMDVHIDSRFSDTKDGSSFTSAIQNTLRNVKAIGVESITMPQLKLPLSSNKTLRWTIDEEKDARAAYPSDFSGVEATDKTVMSITTNGNFAQVSDYMTIGTQMVSAMHSTLPSLSFVNEGDAIVTNLWASTPNVTHTASGNDPVSGESGHEPLNQFDDYTPVNPASTIEYNFVPRVAVTINRDGKTEILSNFRLRLRTGVYNGTTAQTPEESLAYTMGFTIQTAAGDAIDDPGVRSYLRQARNSTASAGDTVITNEGELFDGQIYYYKLTSERVNQFSPQQYLFVTTPNIFIRSQQSNDVIATHNVLAKVPIQEYGQYTTYTRDMFNTHYLDVNDVPSISVRVLDADGNEVDFQEGVFSIHLRLWYDGN